MTAQWMGLDRQHGNALVPLLVGEQGCGKTSFTKMIQPPALQPDYNARVDFRNDRALMQGLSAFALINIDEFDSYSVRRQPIMKYLISKSEVTAMKAYSSTFTTGRRYASFIAILIIQHCHFITFFLGIAAIHSIKHLTPILGFGSASSWMQF